MKKYFIILFLTSFIAGYSQNIKNPKVAEVTQKDIVKILSSVESFSKEEGKKLGIGLFKISNGSGSAHVVGDDEISESLIITVGDYDSEYPNIKVFSVRPFYALKITKKADLGDNYIFYLQHIVKGKRENHRIIISPDKIVYK